ncbi:MAG: hypothetical protein AMXMBFR56_07050 [Polyangiaceae bacterium]
MIERALLLVLALALAGCSDDAEAPGKSASGGGTGGAGTGGTSSGGSGGSGASDAGANDDWALFQSILEGKTDAASGLAKIAASDGFPVQAPGGFLFVRLDDGKGPYGLAGDHNAWQPSAMQAEAGLYWIVAPIAEPDGKKYKLEDGAQQLAADPLARRFDYDQYGEYSSVRASAAHLERWLDVGGSGLPGRSLRVRVPAVAATHHLYVHDGQNLFDPNGAFGSWKLDESAGPATLLVGIDNAGAARMDEYTHVADVISGQTTGGKGDAYADFVKDVVRPLIEARYGQPQKVGVMGSSLGGLISFHQVLRHPGTWDYAASLSGTFGWGSIGAKNETLIARFAKAGKQDTKLYLDSGGGPGSGCADSDGDGTNDDAPDADDNYCETLQLRDVLASQGYVFDQDLWHWWESGAPHNEAAWAARVFRPLQAFEGM